MRHPTETATMRSTPFQTTGIVEREGRDVGLCLGADMRAEHEGLPRGLARELGVGADGVFRLSVPRSRLGLEVAVYEDGRTTALACGTEELLGGSRRGRIVERIGMGTFVGGPMPKQFDSLCPDPATLRRDAHGTWRTRISRYVDERWALNTVGLEPDTGFQAAWDDRGFLVLARDKRSRDVVTALGRALLNGRPLIMRYDFCGDDFRSRGLCIEALREAAPAAVSPSVGAAAVSARPPLF